jgi:PAS domain S-box-containing protein
MAVAAVAVALVWRQAMVSALHAELSTYITFYPAVMLVALLAGQWAGLVATALSALVVDYWILPPVGRFAIEKPADAVGLALFGLMGVFMSVVAERYRRNRERAAAVEKELAVQKSKVALAESEQRWATTLRSIGDAVIAVDADGKITFMNERAQSLTGWNETEAKGKPAEEIFRIAHEQTGETLESPIGRAMRLNQVVEMANHAVVISRGGNHVPVEDSAAPIRDEIGKLAGVVLVFRDVTERRARQREREELLQALRRQADLLRLSFDAIIVWQLGGAIESWNVGAERLYGFSESEALSRVTHELLRTVHPKPWPEIEARLRESGNWEGELRHFTKDGREVIVSARMQLIVGADSVERILETNRDITERKRAEEALRQSLERLERVLEVETVGVMFWDLNTGCMVDANDTFLKLMGYSRSEVEARELTWQKLTPPDYMDVSRAEVEKFLATGRVGPYEKEYFRKDGTRLWLLFAGSSLGNNQCVEFCVDISERKKAEEALRASEERWATTLRSIGDAVIATCAKGRVIFMNEVAERLTGWPLAEAQGRDLEEVFNIVNEVTRIRPESPVAKVISMGQVVGLANHTALISRSGTELPIEDSGAPIRDKDGQVTGVVLVFHDISEKRRAEKAVRDSERLATTGRMAATLAHEIHNPLDTVGNLLFLIDHSRDTPEMVRQHASVAGEELARVTQMTRHMLSFQREAKSPVPVKIGEVLDNVIALFERKIESSGIQVEKQVEFEEEFLGLPGEMRQVFANLLGNAIEAIGKKGKIRLHAYASTDWHRGRRGLRVTVADNGPGIPDGIRGKIFEPFFTTKGEAGTGLGLWITFGIIEKNDGSLRLRSVTRAGRSGTCFSVFIPVK